MRASTLGCTHPSMAAHVCSSRGIRILASEFPAPVGERAPSDVVAGRDSGRGRLSSTGHMLQSLGPPVRCTTGLSLGNQHSLRTQHPLRTRLPLLTQHSLRTQHPLCEHVLAIRPRTGPKRTTVARSATSASASGGASDGPLLVTVIGKGGSGKTTAALLLAKSYAAAGKRTCLLLQSLDRYAEELLGCTVSATEFTQMPEEGGNFCAIRLDTTKFLLEPLEVIKEADERLGLSQGALAEVVGEELSVLPGLDSLAAITAIELLAKPGGGLLSLLERRRGKSKAAGSVLATFPWGAADAEVVVFDGPSSSDTLRILGSPERGRWYLRRFRAVAERTDAGRVALPSIARALESELGLKGPGGQASKTSADVWAKLDDVISVAVDTMMNPKRVKVFLVTPSGDKAATNAALRLWGCTLQAGACVTALLHHGAKSTKSTNSTASLGPTTDSTNNNINNNSDDDNTESASEPEGYKEGTAMKEGTAVKGSLSDAFKGLPLVLIPTVASSDALADAASSSSKELEGILFGAPGVVPRKPVEVDLAASTVSVFLPGFQKSDVKLQQWKNGSQLLVDAGDQRRIIDLHPQMRGKIAGAKFVDGCLQMRTKA